MCPHIVQQAKIRQRAPSRLRVRDHRYVVVVTRAPLAIRQHKRLLAQAAEAGFETVLNLEKQTISNLIFTEDYGEALRAFAEKRKPEFKGR